MAERRSGRSRKPIDYSKFAADGSDDDDFKDSSPPAKKRKEKTCSDISSNLKLIPDNLNENTKCQSKKEQGQKERISVTEKVFQRNLETALELSKSQESNNKIANNTDDDFKGSISKVVNVKLTRIPEVVEEKEGSDSTSTEKETSDSSSSEDQSNSSEEESNIKLKKGNQSKVQDSGSEYEYDSSDAEEKKARLKTKVKPINTLTPTQRKCSSLKGSLHSHDSTSSEKCTTSQKKTSLVKPSSLKINNICKIPSMGLRLGLSRKAVVKSLHPVLPK